MPKKYPTQARAIDAVARSRAQAQRRAQQDYIRMLKAEEAARKSAERQRKYAEFEARRQQAQTERERKQLEKEAKEQHLAERQEEADDLNAQLLDRITSLSTLLQHTLDVDDTIAFDSLRVTEAYPPFTPPQELTMPLPPTPDRAEFLRRVKPKGLLENALGIKNRYQRELQAAEAQYEEATKAHIALEAERSARLAQLKAEYDRSQAAFLDKVHQRDLEVIALEAEYKAGEPAAVMSYTTMVLERSEYPDGFPQSFRLAYVPESKEMVAEYELPWIDAMPAVVEYRYNKTKDAIDEKPRKPAEVQALYREVVAAMAIRTIHEVLEADQGDHIQVITFNGLVTAVDPATGRDAHTCLISVRTTKSTFVELNLRRIDKQICLRNLGAQVSARPDERMAVKPVVEFDMVDKRFVEQSDMLSGLDTRPNLMDLNPTEFEHLVSNLFGKMGLDTKLTRASKDGGVDAVAFDIRPVLGGKVVIQAKRYKNVVGVSAVRDLYGTMLNEGASKGIIVTTSNYGPDAYEFSKDKPMELIDGGGLLYLLDQVGVKAKIIMPQE